MKCKACVIYVTVDSSDLSRVFSCTAGSSIDDDDDVDYEDDDDDDDIDYKDDDDDDDVDYEDYGDNDDDILHYVVNFSGIYCSP